MASLFYLPWAIVRDVAGVGIPGAQVYFTQTATNTKKSVYQDSGLVTPHTNPVICDGVGNPPITYLDPTVSYRVRIYDRGAEAGVDTPIKDIDPYVPGIFADATALQPVADNAANSASAATNSAAIAAAAVTTVETIVASATDLNTQAQAAVTSIAAALGPSVLTLSQLVASGMPLNALWFAGGRTEAAINAAIAESKGLRNTGEGYASAGPPVYVPYGDWTLNSTVAWDHALHFFGDFGSGPSGGGTVLKTVSNITALMVKPGADGSIIRNLYLQGAYTSTESAAHGIHLKTKAQIRDVFIENFAGDAIYGSSTVDGSNFNDIEISHPCIQGCRNGIYLEGADANAITIFHPEIFLSRRYAIWSKDSIGQGAIVGGDYSSNGRDSARPTMCIYSSKWYYVLPGQSVGAKANAPTGSATNNTYWGYLGNSPGTATYQPAWANTIDFRDGGVMLLEGASNTCSVYGGYQEPDQPPASSSAGHTAFYGFGARNTIGEPHPACFGGNTASGTVGGLAIGSLTSTGDVFARGQITFLENANEVFRIRDAGETVGWSMSAGPYGATLTDASDPSKVLWHWNGSNGAYALGRVTDYRQAIVLGRVALGSIGTTNPRFLDMSTAAPVTGDRARGEIVFNCDVSLTAPKQWNCITGHATNGGTWAADYIYARADASTGIGYVTGAGGAVIQATSRTTAPPAINKVCGAITLVSAAGSASWQTFTVSNSTVAATDTIRVVQKSGTDKYMIHVTNVGAGTFDVTFATTGGTTTEQPVFNFSVLKAVAA